METFLSTIGVVGAAIVALVLIGLLVLKFYTLSTKEKSFIRTGVGGEKVVINGGAFVIPGVHQAMFVNMKTLKLEVSRSGKDSLVAGDKMRVDVKVDFFVRVKADAESISKAATTLGAITMDASSLRTQVEAKFVDALRAVAAKMPMHELHEKRAEFVQAVQHSVAEDLLKNGLELESVSLTSLNQTDKEFFDPNNAFDAEGLAQLTRQTETRRKEVNAVQQETRVAIAEKDLNATQQTLALKRSQSEAELNNEREIATMTATQTAEVARVNAEGRRLAESADLEAGQQIAQKRIDTERAVAESDAAKKKAVETAQIGAETAIRLASQEQAITVANKSREEAAAEATAAEARALAVAADEKVTTAREVEIANRSKAVTLVQAEEKARQASIGITVAAEAEREAAENIAHAARTRAEGDKDAAVLRAEATIAEGNAVAQALREKNEAQNILSPELIAQQVKMQLLAALPAIIEQSVKPLENIDSIRIAEVGGLNGNGGGNGGTASAGGNGGLGNEVVNSALRYRTAQPVVDALLAEVGLKGGGDMNLLLGSAAGLAGVAMASADSHAPVAPAAPEASEHHE
jgi:uncharacterized membrane protein YqiK